MNVRPVYAASLMAVSLTAAAATLAQRDPVLAEYFVVPDTYYDPLAIVDDDEGMSTATEANPPYTEPPITVTITPQDRDTLINKDVMDALSSEPRLSGKIGVETSNQVVTLTGRVSTTGQVERAGRIARGVTDVSDVQNLLHARVGG